MLLSSLIKLSTISNPTRVPRIIVTFIFFFHLRHTFQFAGTTEQVLDLLNPSNPHKCKCYQDRGTVIENKTINFHQNEVTLMFNIKVTGPG